MKLLMYDFEVSPTLEWAYGIWQSNAIKTEIEPFVLCFSYRWYGEEKTYNVRTRLKRGDVFKPLVLKFEERRVLDKLWNVLDAADVVVGHNAQGFDNKVAMAAFLRHGMIPPSPFKTIDTLKIARQVARFNSNRLDDLCQLLGIGSKTKVKHSDIWYEYINGVGSAIKQMVEYCNQDVDLLYKLYELLRPYAKIHPNLTVRSGVFACPRCASKNIQRRGVTSTQTVTYQQWWCKNCGAWPRERLADTAVEKPELV